MSAWISEASLVAVGLMVVISPGRAQAPDRTIVYSRIANWQIARPNWDAYAADLQKNTVPILEKLLVDGVITEYGVASAAVHTPDGYTHSTWSKGGERVAGAPPTGRVSNEDTALDELLDVPQRRVCELLVGAAHFDDVSLPSRPSRRQLITSR
jgi:hypothetical protein